MNLENFDIDWKQIKSGVNKQWIKLPDKGSRIYSYISDKPATDTGEFCGPKEDSIKKIVPDTGKH